MKARRRRLLVGSLVVGVLAGIAVGITLALDSGARRQPRANPPAATAEVASWVRQERLPPAALPGAKLFVTSGCTVCHVYAGSGRSQLRAPDLTAIGSRHLGIAFEIRNLQCPACVHPGSPMPHFDSLGSRRLRQLAVFLEASKGIR